jgi:Family of unknown function (DUF6156)
MKTLILLLVVLGAGLTGGMAWQNKPRKHDPVEYFSGWDGYGLPIRLTGLITREEAEAIAARGNAYMIGYFDSDNRLVRNVKMLRGAVFFEHVYDYYPNGRLRRVKATNPEGVETVREYRQTDRVGFFW